jgi:hypothetical protein
MLKICVAYPGWKIRKEDQGKKERFVSAKDVHHGVIQADNGNTAFLIIAEDRVATATALSSNVMLGALPLLLGAGTTTIILRLSSPQGRPQQ